MRGLAAAAFGLLLLMAGTASGLLASSPAAVAAPAPLFGESSFTLPNGLQVVVIPNHRAPIVTQMLWYKAGAADEDRGHSGAAHFLEHLMFKGTKTQPPKAFSEIVARNGGEENAFTSWDYTAFYQTVASDRLDLVMRLEADRMQNLVITQDQLLPERQVILEEWRMRIGNVPSAILSQQVQAALYLNHPYRIPVLGWFNEMEVLDVPTEQRFYSTWYAPDNAILIVAGDTTPAAVRKLAEKYYGPVPARPVPARLRPQEPPRPADVTVDYTSEQVRNPSWSRSWLAPSYRASSAVAGDSRNVYALQVLAEVLGSTPNGRLHRSLVLGQNIATGASASYDGDRYDLGNFEVEIQPRSGVSLDAVAKAGEAVIRDLLDHGVTDDEVERAKTRLRQSVLYSSDSLTAPAQIIGVALTTGRSLAELDAWPEHIGEVTTAEVDAAAHQIFDGRPSVTGRLLPKPAPGEAGPGEAGPGEAGPAAQPAVPQPTAAQPAPAQTVPAQPMPAKQP